MTTMAPSQLALVPSPLAGRGIPLHGRSVMRTWVESGRFGKMTVSSSLTESWCGRCPNLLPPYCLNEEMPA